MQLLSVQLYPESVRVRLSRDRLLMVHPRHRDGSGLRRTPALVGLHRPSARRCQRLPTPVPPLAPADAHRLPPPLPPSCRHPDDGYPSVRSTENFRALENFQNFLNWVSPPKKTGGFELAAYELLAYKSVETQNAASRNLALTASNPTLHSLRTTASPLASPPRPIATQPPP